jgi:hypothetical protein
MSLIAAMMSALRGNRYVYKEEAAVIAKAEPSAHLRTLRMVAVMAIARAKQQMAVDDSPEIRARLDRALALLALVEQMAKGAPSQA